MEVYIADLAIRARAVDAEQKGLDSHDGDWSALVGDLRSTNTGNVDQIGTADCCVKARDATTHDA